MLDNWQIGLQLEFLIDIIIALAAGFVIGAERESRGKPAGISIRFGKKLLQNQSKIYIQTYIIQKNLYNLNYALKNFFYYYNLKFCDCVQSFFLG